jgi:sodium transport system permease protein
MKNILTIFKKEWDRVIKDKRLVITVILLPGLMIYLIYSFLGSAITNFAEEEIYDIAIVNLTDDFEDIYNMEENRHKLNVVEISDTEVNTYKQKVDDEEWTIVIEFPEDLEAYDGTGEKPAVSIYSNPNVMSSSSISSRFFNYLVLYQNSLSYDLYGDTNFFYLAQIGTEIDDQKIAGTLMASLLPMLVIMFLFSGAMSVGPESIAGEKERGTIATLLITPIKRSQLALGKVLSLSVLSLLSAISSFLGIILSLPKLLNFDNADASIYSFSQYLMILLVLFSTIFVIVGIISIVSAYAKSLKEANSYIAPIYILTILVSITSAFSDGANPNLYLYVLPIFNSVQSLIAIMTFSESAWSYLLVTVIANIVYLVIFVTILNKMFNSEKIMFAK